MVGIKFIEGIRVQFIASIHEHGAEGNVIAVTVPVVGHLGDFQVLKLLLIRVVNGSGK